MEQVGRDNKVLHSEPDRHTYLAHRNAEMNIVFVFPNVKDTIDTDCNSAGD